MSPDEAKRAAAARAVLLVEDGMRLGLGTGTTAAHFVALLGARVREGLRVACVPTSEATRALAEREGVPLTGLEETPRLDLTVDGADEVDPALNLIKGGGGALLREKIVAAASTRMVVIADAAKAVDALGRFPLPLEVVRFGLEATRVALAAAIRSADCDGALTLRRRGDGHAFVTDEGHLILDAALGRIPDPPRLAAALAAVPGLVEHGLFVGMAHEVILAGPDGVETRRAPAPSSPQE